MESDGEADGLPPELAANNAAWRDQPDEIPEQTGEDDGGGGRPNAAARITNFALQRFTFFLDQFNFVNVDVLKGRTRTTMLLDSGEFRQELRRIYRSLTNSVASTDAFGNAISQIEAEVRRQPTMMHVAMRVHRLNDKIYVDMCDEQWRAIEIDRDGWRIVNRVEDFRFRRTVSMLPLPLPQAGGTLDSLREIFNLDDEDDENKDEEGRGDSFYILTFWLCALLTNGPFPALVIIGPDGSAKTVATTFAAELLDPYRHKVSALPKDNDAFIAKCLNRRTLALDNFSRLSADMSDMICRIATGASMPSRKLYTNNELNEVSFMNAVIINGISDLISRRDLASRSMPLRLKPVEAKNRKTMAQMNAKFEELHPQLLGAIFQIASHGLRHEDDFKDAELPRMADAAQWILACSDAIPGCDTDKAKAVMDRMESDLVFGILSGDHFARLLITYLHQMTDLEPQKDGKFKLETTSTKLHDALAKKHKEEAGQGSNAPKFPTSPKSCSEYLRRIMTALDKGGIHVRTRIKDGYTIFVFEWENADKYQLSYGF